MFLKNYFYLIIAIVLGGNLMAQGISLDAGADIVSRYVWRGLLVNNAPNIQPSITLGAGGLSLGLWGSSSLTEVNSTDDGYAFSQEIDFWAGYSFELQNGMSISAVVTDYYYPSAGIEFSNFNNYDDPDGPGAHTVEAGLTIAGPETFPLSFSGFINVHNDAGNNTYFQVDYSTVVENINLAFMLGATGGSEDNPGYYGADGFEIINVGVTVSKEIKITNEFSLPVNASFVLNPNTDISYMVFGISL